MPAVGERSLEQRDAVSLEDVEDNELGRRLLRQQADAALGRMQAQLQRLERAARDQQLAVEDEAGFGDALQPGGDLGKVALERLRVPGLEVRR
jgi:hypothetical protein